MGTKLIIGGVAIVSIAVFGAVAWAIWRSQMQMITDAAQSKAMSDIVTGAAQAARAADATLAAARDPDAAEKALATGTL